MRTQTRQRTGRQAQETDDIERYLAALFGREDRRAYIEIRYRHGDTMRRHFLAHTDTFAAARTIARLGLSSDVYVGVAPRRHDDAGGKDAIDHVWTLWADIDTPNAHDAIGAVPVTPAILIASGTPGHLHAYWPLSEPVGITAAETANRRLAAQLGADAGAVTNAATILRPPGTYSFKTTPPTPVLAQRLDPALTTLQAATDALAVDQPPPTPTTPAPPPTRQGSDPLRALDPAHYVSVLTGQAVGRSRKISCPFHDDRTPSLHVYEHPEDGWYCFGCKRHGHTVYDLASALWGLQTCGSEFLELRERLYALFLPGTRPPRRGRRR
jgi:hypothetical protein